MHSLRWSSAVRNRAQGLARGLKLCCCFVYFCSVFFVSLCWSPHSTVCITISNTDGMDVSPDLPMALTVPGVATKRKEWVGKMVV